MAKPNEFRKEIDIALLQMDQTKSWLAKRMGMSVHLFWAKVNNKPQYKPLSQVEIKKIKKLLNIQ
jgi:hypothetical protein